MVTWNYPSPTPDNCEHTFQPVRVLVDDEFRFNGHACFNCNLVKVDNTARGFDCDAPPLHLVGE